MRLDELSIPKTRQIANEILEKAGYQQLGKGTFATVYAKPGIKHVLKLFDSGDTGYLAFIKLAQTHKNIHFPKFYGKPIKIYNSYYAIRMEQLNDNVDRETVFSLMAYTSPKTTPTNSYWDDTRPINDPELKAACDLVCDLINSEEHFVNDIGRANVLQRDDGTVVISDPIYTMS